MTSIVMPDRPTWQAGQEFGLQALDASSLEAFMCYLPREGPLLEALALAVHQMGLHSRLRWRRRISHALTKADIVFLPRVVPMEQHTIEASLKRGAAVVTSDPGVIIEHPFLFRARRRSWIEMAEAIALAASMPSEKPEIVAQQHTIEDRP